MVRHCLWMGCSSSGNLGDAKLLCCGTLCGWVSPSSGCLGDAELLCCGTLCGCVSSSSGCLGDAQLLWCGTPCDFHLTIFHMKSCDVFSYIYSKHRFLALREAVLTSTPNLCFRAEITKLMLIL